ncbi:Lcl domain-containing protein [Vibrio coralliilyticus]|uniref:Lcl domain-containing protein n=1 Tax=Vibrio coralliilyticus TaxID=190893 RepID=UPI001E651304|nr:DUF1566 domain-containing protein [Vibrio coralliilyticus]MCC2525793.1 DUF1566 domain-containing protein [Vibrio coralliilyticus]
MIKDFNTGSGFVKPWSFISLMGLLAACNDHSPLENTNEGTISEAGATEETPIKTGLYAIQLSHKDTTVLTGSEISLFAMGAYDNGNTEDITQSVKWEVADSTIMSVTPENKIRGNQMGTSTVSASLDGITASLSLEVKESMCGASENDLDKENSLGQCLKVLRGISGEAKDKWFTSTPSVNFLDLLGYQQDNSENNQGRSYARTTYQIGHGELAGETLELSPSGAPFALFRQDGLNWDDDPNSESFGARGQFERYCRDLADIKFNGRSDWRRPTAKELVALYADHGRLWDNYGFPSTYVYWTSTPAATSGNFIRFGFLNGEEYGTSPNVAVAASCVSQTG